MNRFIALNLAELVGQHPLGGKRDETSQFTESPRAFTEVIKNGDFILSTDDLEDCIDRRSVARARIFSASLPADFFVFFYAQSQLSPL
jgi:hypothetical protein